MTSLHGATRTASGREVPAIRPFDIYQVHSGDGDYHAWFKQQHEPGVPDIFWTESSGGHWVITRGDDFRYMMDNPQWFSSGINIVPRELRLPVALKPINLDPPEHSKWRAILTPFFTPKAVVPLGEEARALTRTLIAGFHARGECDFVHEFARILPIAIFMRMVGIADEERLKLLAYVDALVRPQNEQDMQSRFALIGYAQGLIQQRRTAPGTDLISHIVQARVDGQPIDDPSLIGIIILVLTGGLDTVASVLGFATRFLALHPEHRRQLVEKPELIPNAVEELLRRFPVTTMVRIVAQDHEYKGVQFRKDDLVLAHTSAHGLDDRQFAEPMSVDFERRLTFHGTFGSGPHRCIGSMLARVELRVFLEEWLRAIPDFSLQAGKALKVESGMVVTMHSLPICWPVQPKAA